ncbi:MAG: hypothetical protein ACRELY_32815 [Polyangiaceae bacterium]
MRHVCALTSLALHVLVFAGVTRLGKKDARAGEAVTNSVGAGDTFDVSTEPENDPSSDDTTATENSGAPQDDGIEIAGTAAMQHRHDASAHATASGESKSDGTARDQVFGARGDRSAVDLATAFTRSFPQVASADPAWAKAPLGSAGSLDVEIEIDDQGNVVSANVAGGLATLRASAERTLMILRHRTFTAHSLVTTLHIAGEVSRDTVHDGLHGDVFAVGGSFTSHEGDGFFALAIGRRIDVHVTEK